MEEKNIQLVSPNYTTLIVGTLTNFTVVVPVHPSKGEYYNKPEGTIFVSVFCYL